MLLSLIYNLLRVETNYLMISIQRYEEKERKCQNFIFYRNFYKRVKEAQIKPLYIILNTYGVFYEIAKPINNENLTEYALTLQSALTNIKAYENELKSIYDIYKEIYRMRIKSWFYCVVFDS